MLRERMFTFREGIALKPPAKGVAESLRRGVFAAVAGGFFEKSREGLEIGRGFRIQLNKKTATKKTGVLDDSPQTSCEGF